MAYLTLGNKDNNGQCICLLHGAQEIMPAVGNALPTISLAAIKTDNNGKNHQAKYCICVLGNLDPTNWSRNKVFALVLSQIKLRLLIIIAVQKIYKVNAGYFKQAFCQACLPDGDTYVLHPPKYYPITHTNMYLQII